MMKLDTQKRLAAGILKVGKARVWFDDQRLEEIKEAITREDMRGLIKGKAIQKKPLVGVSRARARKRKLQRSKGRQAGPGSRKGKKGARLSSKKRWMMKVRAQRGLLKTLKEKDLLNQGIYRKIYLKVKGGFFRSRRHILLYLKDHNLFKGKNEIQKKKKM